MKKLEYIVKIFCITTTGILLFYSAAANFYPDAPGIKLSTIFTAAALSSCAALLIKIFKDNKNDRQ